MFSSLRATASSSSGAAPARDDELGFASLICSRLCHDLVGPVGAITNGIELIEMEDDLSDAGEALDLLRHSADNASRRLRFLRLAFGSSGGDDMPLPVEDARKAAFGFFEDYRLELVWPGAEAGASKGRVRLAMNLLMAGAGGLIRGGELSVELSSTRLVINGVHERAGLGEATVDALTGVREASAGEDARIIESFLAHKLAAAEGLTIKVEQGAGRFLIAAV